MPREADNGGGEVEGPHGQFLPIKTNNTPQFKLARKTGVLSAKGGNYGGGEI